MILCRVLRPSNAHGAGVLWLQAYDRRCDDERIRHRTDQWQDLVRLVTTPG